TPNLHLLARGTDNRQPTGQIGIAAQDIADLQNQPPFNVTAQMLTTPLRVGQVGTVQVSAQDDIAVASIRASFGGVTKTLNAPANSVTFTTTTTFTAPSIYGTYDLVAVATDSLGAQTTVTTPVDVQRDQ